MIKLVKVPETAFADLVAGCGMKEKAAAIARAVLVDGRHIGDVAGAHGVTRQRVYDILDRLSWHYASMQRPIGATVRVTRDVQDSEIANMRAT